MGTAGQTPGSGRRWTAALTLGNDPMSDTHLKERPESSLRWEAVVEWNRERADGEAFAADPDPAAAAERDWWRLYAKLSL